ncbi:MAG: TonB-dependent receptor [Myxococcota bacterium]|nr:TonB-dependent receptor [Myxococcota bacterium]
MAGGGSGQTFRAAGSVTGRSGPVAWRFSGGQERTDSWQLEIDDRRFDQQPFADDPTLAYDRTWAAADLRLRPARGWLAYLGSSVSSTDTLIYGISRLRQVWLDDYVYAQTHASVRSPSGLGLRAFWNSLHSAVDIAAQVDGGIPTLDESVSQQVVDVELDWARDFHFLVDHSFTVGVGYRYKSVDWDWLLGFHEEHHLAAYIQDRMVIADRLRLLLSARLDRHPLLPDLQFSPRGSIVYRLTEGSSVRVTGGTAFRTPTFLESYVNFLNRTPVRGVTALGVGSTDLDPEAITSFEIGYTNQESDWFALEANAYYNLVDDFILLSSIDTFTLADYQSGRVRYLEDEAAFPLGALRFANDRNRFRQIGGEVGLRLFPITGLDVYVNYSLHDTSPVGDTAALGTRARDQRTSTHKVNAGVQYRSRFGLDVAADVHWLSDQLWTEQVTDTRTGVRFDPFPLDGYTLVNGRVGYRLLDDRVELAISGTNLLGERMRQHPFGQRLDRRVMGSATVRF